MKRWAKVAFDLFLGFLFLFLLGITDFGQHLLRGRIPPNASHSELDDIYMSAGLAPWVYRLAPCLLLAPLGGALLLLHNPKHRRVR